MPTRVQRPWLWVGNQDYFAGMSAALEQFVSTSGLN
jgi:hypothetical protein